MGKLVKLSIEAYADPKCKLPPESTFSVMFNPSSYTAKYAVEYDAEQGKGTTGLPQRYQRTKPIEFDFEFVLDATGASVDVSEEERKHGVSETVKRFLQTVQEFDGSIHRTRYLKLNWGKVIAQCVFQAGDVKYTLFSPDGVPLRATVSASFSQYVEAEKMVAQQNEQSADLMRVHVVQEGETLPQLAYMYYEDAGNYMHVARFNQLDNLFDLRVGQALVFPRLENGRGASPSVSASRERVGGV